MVLGRKGMTTPVRVRQSIRQCVLSSVGVPFYRGWLSGLPVNCRPGYRVGWFRLVLLVLLLHEGVGPSVGLALESDHASVVDGAVDDRGGHVGVSEHASPSGELDVRGVDDGLGLVRVGDDLEEEPAALLVYGHVAELVDDEEPCLWIAVPCRVRPPHWRAGGA